MRNLSLLTSAAFLLLLGAASLARGDEGTDRCAIARWFFNGSGWDEMGYHPITIHGEATFVPTCGGEGLFANDAASYGTYPPFGAMPAGTISFEFELDEAFHADPAYYSPIIIMNSNRDGSLVGDISVRLDPEDGKLWFVQERELVDPDWLLKSTKSYWEPGVCYRVEIEWGLAGRCMKITTPGYFEMHSDPVVRAFVFSLDATLTTVLSRAADSPPNGVMLDWLEVACPCPPVGIEPTSWGSLKSSYR